MKMIEEGPINWTKADTDGPRSALLRFGLMSPAEIIATPHWKNYRRSVHTMPVELASSKRFYAIHMSEMECNFHDVILDHLWGAIKYGQYLQVDSDGGEIRPFDALIGGFTEIINILRAKGVEPSCPHALLEHYDRLRQVGKRADRLARLYSRCAEGRSAEVLRPSVDRILNRPGGVMDRMYHPVLGEERLRRIYEQNIAPLLGDQGSKRKRTEE
jgi:hypothetical protein